MRLHATHFALALLLFATVQGCHYKDKDDDDDKDYDDRRRRRQVLSEAEDTGELRGFFVSCLRNKLGNLLESWETALDFTVLDTRWYQNSDLEFCSVDFDADSKECWIERLNELVSRDSSLSIPTQQCIEEYDALSGRSHSDDPTCEQGGWTPLFDIGASEDGGEMTLNDFHESFPGGVCASPTIVEAQLINGSDVISKQRAEMSSGGGLRCSKRSGGPGCQGFSFRFCCPASREIYPRCEGDQWTQFFNTDRNRTDGGDFEDIFEAMMGENGDSICQSPSAMDVRLTSGQDYRLGGQRVSLSLDRGFRCADADQAGRCRDYRVRYCCPEVQTLQRGKRQIIFDPNDQLVSEYEDCLSNTVDLPSYRRPLDYDTLFRLIEEHLICELSELGDCSSNVTAEVPDSLAAWPYRLEALCRDDSPLSGPLEQCNDLVFPLEELQGGWGRWSPWDNCPARCGESGVQLRRRQCLVGPAGIHPCIGQLHQMRSCQPEGCAFFREWSAWSACPDNQPGSSRRRTRICINGNPGIPGCQGQTIQEEPCGGCDGADCAGADFSRWSSWDPCPAQCGSSGIRRRRRHCTTGIGARCRGEREETQACQAENCPNWSAWEQWTGACPGTCQPTQRTRTRRCLLGGVLHHACPGATTSSESCALPAGCGSGDGFLSPWSQYDPCPAQCGHSAFHTRRRHCTNGPNGGPGCTAHLEERKECRADDCPEWGNWQPWSSCEPRCGDSSRRRRRQCLLRGASHHNCQGSAAEAEPCLHPSCVFGDQFLSPWSEFDPCPAQCGQTAFHNRRRQCTNGPSGSPGCMGSLVERKQCTRRCTRWSEWGQYGACPVSCGRSTQTRTRHCIDGSIGDEGCHGDSTSTRPCDIPCTGGGNDPERGFSPWSSWGYCPAQCGRTARRLRRRHCTTGPLGSPGCSGDQVESEECSKQCGIWSQWTEFSACVAPCGHSTTSRRRTCIGGVVGEEACYGPAFESHRCHTGRPCI